jgi:hypothetical protein
MTLPEELEYQYEKEIEQYEEVRKVEWLSNFERRVIKKGIQQGSVQTAREDVLEVLNLRFKDVSHSLSERIYQIEDPSVLKELHRKGITASSLEEFQAEMLSIK